MRSERRKEIKAQMEAEKNAAAKKRGNTFCRAVSVIYSILAIAFIALLAWLDVLPAKYFISAAAVLVVASLFIVPVMYSKNGKKSRKILSTCVAFILIGVFGVGTWYFADTLSFLDDISSVGTQTENFYVVVRSDSADASGAGDMQDEQGLSALAGKILGTVMDEDLNYSKAKAMLQKEVDVEYAYESDAGSVLEKLINGGAGSEGSDAAAAGTGTVDAENPQSYEAVFISAASYESLKGEYPDLEEKTGVLHTVKVPIENGGTAKAVNVTKESFNVYISGIDVEGDISTVSRSDVNMIATVNPKTHHVLLTSIPRDYYVTLPTKNASDKLTHSGLYGIQETMGAVENIMGIDFNYYVRVNYTTVVKLVDAIGGIEVESPFEFTTSGMQQLNGHHFVKGKNYLDGNAALAFCRERHSFLNGDMQRNENQQLVLEGIIRKATGSSAILTSYTSILDAVRGNMETNMTPEEMSSLIKMQLNDMSGWKIEKQSIKGTNGFDQCYALGFAASIVNQDPEENARAIDKIVKVMTGESESAS